jgi:hypothetical protein
MLTSMSDAALVMVDALLDVEIWLGDVDRSRGAADVWNLLRRLKNLAMVVASGLGEAMEALQVVCLIEERTAIADILLSNHRKIKGW